MNKVRRTFNCENGGPAPDSVRKVLIFFKVLYVIINYYSYNYKYLLLICIILLSFCMILELLSTVMGCLSLFLIYMLKLLSKFHTDKLTSFKLRVSNFVFKKWFTIQLSMFLLHSFKISRKCIRVLTESQVLRNLNHADVSQDHQSGPPLSPDYNPAYPVPYNNPQYLSTSKTSTSSYSPPGGSFYGYTGYVAGVHPSTSMYAPEEPDIAGGYTGYIALSSNSGYPVSQTHSNSSVFPSSCKPYPLYGDSMNSGSSTSKVSSNATPSYTPTPIHNQKKVNNSAHFKNEDSNKGFCDTESSLIPSSSHITLQMDATEDVGMSDKSEIISKSTPLSNSTHVSSTISHLNNVKNTNTTSVKTDCQESIDISAEVHHAVLSIPVSPSKGTSTAKKIKLLPLPKVPDTSQKSKKEQFHEYVGEVARLNAEIERLQKLQEKYKNEAKMIATASGSHEMLTVKKELIYPEKKLAPESTNTKIADVEYVPCSSPSTVASYRPFILLFKEPAPVNDQSKPILGYTPTPIADLKKMKEIQLKNKDPAIVKKLGAFKTESSVKLKSKPIKRTRELSEEEISVLFDDTNPISNGLISNKAPKSKDCMNTSKVKLEPVISTVKEKRLPMSADSLGGVLKGKELTAEQIAAARHRIARSSNIVRPITTARKPLTIAEQLQKRMEAVTKEKELAEQRAKEPCKKTNKPLTMEQMYGQRKVGTVGSAKKGEIRSARTAQVAKLSGCNPQLREPSNSKVPMTIRLTFLNRIFAQYLEVCPREEAITNAEVEEKLILDKVGHTQGYKVAAVNLISRIRSTLNDSTKSTKHSALSHHAVLAGRHVNDISVGVRRTQRQDGGLAELVFYQALESKHLMTEEQLVKNGLVLLSYILKLYRLSIIIYSGFMANYLLMSSFFRYPRPIPGGGSAVTIEQSHFEKSKASKCWADNDDLVRYCARCHKEFTLDRKGAILRAECIYHFKNLQKRGGMRGESYYACCGTDRSTPGCCVADAHVSETLSKDVLLEFVLSPPSYGDNDPRNNKVFALDCEMVYGVWGPELARLSVVDINNKLILDLIVKPKNAVIDYNTRFSGLTANSVETSTTDIHEAQNRLFELVNERTILIGHSLESDLKALRIVHNRVVDTAVVYEHKQVTCYVKELILFLNYLELILHLRKVSIFIENYLFTEGGHDSQEDAAACMSLMLLKVKNDGIGK
uniref:Exonuclease domain-containing protein n=1 Tax=Heterorhabditis bacteriophora TaxID=37862 RepID=A0A1I7X2D1_HETBA